MLSPRTAARTSSRESTLQFHSPPHFSFQQPTINSTQDPLPSLCTISKAIKSGERMLKASDWCGSENNPPTTYLSWKHALKRVWGLGAHNENVEGWDVHNMTSSGTYGSYVARYKVRQYHDHARVPSINVRTSSSYKLRFTMPAQQDFRGHVLEALECE